MNKLANLKNKLAMAALMASAFMTGAAHAAEGDTTTAATTLTDMAKAIDVSDAKGGILYAAGVIMGLLVLVWGVRKLFGMFRG